MTLLIFASAILVLLMARSVAVIIYANSPRRTIETRLTKFVGR